MQKREDIEAIVDYLTSYSTFLDFKDLPREVVHQAKRLLVDSLGGATGGFAREPSKIARKIASSVHSEQSATIIGSGQRTTAELATFPSLRDS